MPSTMLAVLLLAVAAAAAPAASGEPSSNSSCKTVPADAGWPSADTWQTLNATTGGRLLRPSAPGAVCHPSSPAYSAERCPAVQALWFDESFHADDPVSVQWNNWNNDSCIPDPSLTCSAAGYPVYVINATTPQHVKAGIDFARKYKIRLIVKNSGHDYIGRSSAPNSLSIWVHHMKGIQLHRDSFNPQGCGGNVTIAGAAVTALAGTQMVEAYEATAAINHTVIGGNGRTVALGGFITGAGHSILAPHYGLAADHVLEMEMVSPSGEILTANECQNTDLFWAMRGGGGSTFGVLTSVTMSIVPSPSVMNMDFYVMTDSTNPQAFDMVAYVMSKLPDLVDAGVSGYPGVVNTVAEALIIPAAANSTRFVKGMMGKLIMLNTTNPANITRLFDPIFAHINATWPGFTATTNTTFFPSFNEWYRVNYDPTLTGFENIVGSRLLNRDALTTDPMSVKVAIAKFSAWGQAEVFMVSGKGVHDAKPRGGGNAVLPAWRNAYVHATTSIKFLPQDAASKASAIEASQFSVSALRDIAPYTGAYMNEASRYEPDWQRTFWGDNYDRLLRIKRAVDPDDVFWCMPCVGNERWHEDGARLCPV